MMSEPRLFRRYCGTCNQPTDLHSAYESLKAELAAWIEIEKVSERKRHEIYAMAYKLKPGKYGSAPLPDLPTCSMSPESIKMHDDICDILEARAFNEDEVSTASVGIWAAIGACEKERDQLRAIASRLAGALERIYKQSADGMSCGIATDALKEWREFKK